MNSPLEIVKQLQIKKLYDEDGKVIRIEMLPPISENELKQLEASIPIPIPGHVLELLKYSKGLDGLLESINFAGELDFGMEDLFPCALPIAHDGFGNFWVIDLTAKSTDWGPISFCCHDAPVVVFHTFSFSQFLEDLIEFGTDFKNSRLNKIHEDLHMKIWKENPNVLTYEQCINSGDTMLIQFAASLNDKYLIIDLRNPNFGDGFSWGRFEPRTVLKRFGEERIFAYEKKKSFFERMPWLPWRTK